MTRPKKKKRARRKKNASFFRGAMFVPLVIPEKTRAATRGRTPPGARGRNVASGTSAFVIFGARRPRSVRAHLTAGPDRSVPPPAA
jgi:hypothetical protein